MSLMRFLCGLLSGRCGCETPAPETGRQRQASSAATDVQPNAPDQIGQPRERAPSPEELLYSSPNGDEWHLVKDPLTGTVCVRHIPNPASGGVAIWEEVDAFLSRGRHPQQQALLRLIATLIED
jgi:hypothetical protein